MIDLFRSEGVTWDCQVGSSLPYHEAAEGYSNHPILRAQPWQHLLHWGLPLTGLWCKARNSSESVHSPESSSRTCCAQLQQLPALAVPTPTFEIHPRASAFPAEVKK